jgi:hypothetical protein
MAYRSDRLFNFEHFRDLSCWSGAGQRNEHSREPMTRLWVISSEG